MQSRGGRQCHIHAPEEEKRWPVSGGARRAGVATVTRQGRRRIGSAEQMQALEGNRFGTDLVRVVTNEAVAELAPHHRANGAGERGLIIHNAPDLHQLHGVVSPDAGYAPSSRALERGGRRVELRARRPPHLVCHPFWRSTGDAAHPGGQGLRQNRVGDDRSYACISISHWIMSCTFGS